MNLEELILALHEQSREENIPSVKESTGNFLTFLVTLTRSKRILEIGTAHGLSTLYLAKGLSCNGGGEILTMDRSTPSFEAATKNFDSLGLLEKENDCHVRITQQFGNALELLSNLEGTFDFIFVDAAKREYGAFLKLLLPYTHAGTLCVFDDVIEFAEKMKDFLSEISAGSWSWTVVPTDVDDGVLLLLPKLLSA